MKLATVISGKIWKGVGKVSDVCEGVNTVVGYFADVFTDRQFVNRPQPKPLSPATEWFLAKIGKVVSTVEMVILAAFQFFFNVFMISLTKEERRRQRNSFFSQMGSFCERADGGSAGQNPANK